MTNQTPFYEDAPTPLRGYPGPVPHIIIDGRVTFLGSSNIDLRSFDLNHENDILLQDIATTEAVEKDRQITSVNPEKSYSRK